MLRPCPHAIKPSAAAGQSKIKKRRFPGETIPKTSINRVDVLQELVLRRKKKAFSLNAAWDPISLSNRLRITRQQIAHLECINKTIHSSSLIHVFNLTNTLLQNLPYNRRHEAVVPTTSLPKKVQQQPTIGQTPSFWLHQQE